MHNANILKTEMKRLILWAVPRSRSTALERAVMQRDDTQVFHELLTEPYLSNHSLENYEIIRQAQEQAGIPVGVNSYEQVMETLLADFSSDGKILLFTKELSCYYDSERITPKWLSQFKHLFLVRQPLATLKSFYRVSHVDGTTYFDPKEAGFEELYRIYQLVHNICGKENTLVLEADDDLIRDPEATLRRFCSFAEVNFDPSMLKWSRGDIPAWQKFKGWHQDAEQSSSFKEIKHDPISFPELVYTVATQYQPYYRFLKWQTVTEQKQRYQARLHCLQEVDDVTIRLLIVHDSKDCSINTQIISAFLPDSVGIWWLNADSSQSITMSDWMESIKGLFDLPIVLCSESAIKLTIKFAERLQAQSTCQACLLRVLLLSDFQSIQLDTPVSFLPTTIKDPSLVGAEVWQSLNQDLQAARDLTQQEMIQFNISNQNRYPTDHPLSWRDEFTVALNWNGDHVAISDGQTSLTLAELEAAAEVVAQQLKDQNATGKWVAIVAERSLEAVIAAIGCLHCGSSFVEIPSWYGSDRFSTILNLVKPAVVLTKPHTLENLSDTVLKKVPTQVISLTTTDKQNGDKHEIQIISGGCAENLSTRESASAQDSSFGLLTSGTTGLAKLVKLQNKTILDSLAVWREYIRPGDRIGFNAWLLYYFFYPMFSQATTVIIPDKVVLDPKALANFIRDADLTQVLLTPSLLQGVMNAVPNFAEAFQKVHTLWLCGEKVLDGLRSKFQQAMSHCRLIDLYSSNEAGDTALRESEGGFHFLQGVQFYLLNSEMLPVPKGTIGELYLSTPGLSSGYFGESTLTQQLFQPNPFPSLHPQLARRIYRTGDLARWLGDSRVQVMGRSNCQIKIRGFKVIPENVEGVLTEHPSVLDALVTARKDGIAKQLVAYIVPTDLQSLPNGSELLQWIRSKLPSFSVPSAFYYTSAIAVQLSQKRDRTVLAPMENVQLLPEHQEQLVGMQTEVASVWRELLGEDLPSLVPEDDFFEFGGSLLLASLQTLLNSRTSVDIPLTLLLENSTVAGIAHVIESLRSGQAVMRSEVNLDQEVKIYYPFDQSEGLWQGQLNEYRSKPCKRVLLTGATGYLGGFLLEEIATHADVEQIYCLVRTQDLSLAQQRIWKALHLSIDDLAPQTPVWVKKIIPVCGDLTYSNLGLTDDAFQQLADTVDFVVHAGAEVKLIKPYESLVSVNVAGTREILKFTLRAASSLLFISTTEAQGQICGYNQTKRVAEAICQKASLDKGLPVMIARCGDLSAPSLEYNSNRSYSPINQDDYFNLLLHTCLVLQSYPSDVQWGINLTPVDYAAAALAHLTTVVPDPLVNNLIDLCHPQGAIDWLTLCNWFNQSLTNEQLQPISLWKWKEKLRVLCQQDPILKKLDMLLPLAIQDLETAYSSKHPLQLESISCPTIDSAWIQSLIHTHKEQSL